MSKGNLDVYGEIFRTFVTHPGLLFHPFPHILYTLLSTGQSTTFAYIRDSPEVDASSGVNVVQFWGREFPLKIRRFKISAGFETCKFLQKPQTIRSVVYKKESAVPQRVMWMTTSVGTNSCPFGNWLVQRADDSDYVNAGLNYFELKGSLAYIEICKT